MSSKEFKKIIIERLSKLLKPKGYKRIGNTFSLSNNDLTYFINLQSSMDSTSTMLKLTLNIEIFSAIVYNLEDTSMPEKWSRHYTKRIGFFQDNPQDHWWLIYNQNDANSAAEEIESILLKKVLPTFNDLKSTNDLLELWIQNICPGLTEMQRQEYINLFPNTDKGR